MKYRLGRKQKRAILEVDTGKEYLVFPNGKTEHVEQFLNYLNNMSENKQPSADDLKSALSFIKYKDTSFSMFTASNSTYSLTCWMTLVEEYAFAKTKALQEENKRWQQDYSDLQSRNIDLLHKINALQEENDRLKSELILKEHKK